MVQLVVVFYKGDATVKNVGDFESISSLPLTQEITFFFGPNWSSYFPFVVYFLF
jgi:hypothetical protein